MRLLTRLTALVALLVLMTVPAFAQGTSATLTGTVTSDGKPLPGATITVSSPSLQGTRMAVSGSNGDYSIAALPPGSYTVVVELEGMSKVTAKKQLTLAQTNRVDADLRMAAQSEAITVTAAAPAVMESPQIASNFSKATMDKLPVTRTILSAVILAPGVAQNANAFNNQPAISGAPSYDNVYYMNGTVLNENLRGQPDPLFIAAAIQGSAPSTDVSPAAWSTRSPSRAATSSAARSATTSRTRTGRPRRRSRRSPITSTTSTTHGKRLWAATS